MTGQYAPASGPHRQLLRYLAPAALAILVAAVVAVVLSAPIRLTSHTIVARTPHANAPKIPPYWIVRPGDMLGEIAEKTGLTVTQLEAYNPQIDPNNLVPGQRLNLWRHPPPPPSPRPQPLGPMFWNVQPGQSFGSIAAKTGINLETLEQLNPQLNPATLQPGDRVRLRPGQAPQSSRSALLRRLERPG